MNRKIKFRVWDKINKKWLNSYCLAKFPSGQHYLMYSMIKSEENKFDFEGFAREDASLDNYIFQQYIGLKDKNDNDIYEGDILKIENLKQLEEVEFSGGIFGIYEYEDLNRETGILVPIQEYHPDNIEIVGNIFENREIIKSKNNL